jgi:hypothetical protein
MFSVDAKFVGSMVESNEKSPNDDNDNKESRALRPCWELLDERLA